MSEKMTAAGIAKSQAWRTHWNKHRYLVDELVLQRMIEAYAAAREVELLAVCEAFAEAGRYDAMMEGPKFRGIDASQFLRALKRWQALRPASDTEETRT